MGIQNYMREIESALGPPTVKASTLARYIGARIPTRRKANERSRLVYWGHAVPVHREAARSRYSFSPFDDETQWKIWLRVWRESPVFDVKSVALIWLSDPKRRALRLTRWRDLVSMVDEIDNWAHSDGLSGLLAEILEQRPPLLKLLKSWNRSERPWRRRQSVVSLYYYARLRKKLVPAKTALAFVRPLLNDPHFYVQRGVGWTLREIDRVDKRAQRAFVRRHLTSISPVAWFAVSELYPNDLRRKLVDLRRRS